MTGKHLMRLPVDKIKEYIESITNPYKLYCLDLTHILIDKGLFERVVKKAHLIVSPGTRVDNNNVCSTMWLSDGNIEIIGTLLCTIDDTKFEITVKSISKWDRGRIKELERYDRPDIS